MKVKKIVSLKVSRLLFILVGTIGMVETALANEKSTNYSIYADRSFPENVYWGDTHVHTTLSPDAYTFGNRFGPDMAYRFAKGETVTSHEGERLRIAQPLDFLVVTDHSEYTGVLPKLDVADPVLLKTEAGKRWHEMYQEDKRTDVFWEFVDVLRGKLQLDLSDEFNRSVWYETTAAADQHNDPGKFTAFIGYEWSSMIGGNNLHRNIIFRDDASKANQVIPLSSIDSNDPEDLWKYLKNYEKKTGGKVLAIPHNGNLSNGLMFSDKTLSGKALSQGYAKTRSRWEPVYEVTQFKGDGEAHPYLSPNDEFADYETLDFGNMDENPKKNWMLPHEYARSGLKLGLQLEEKLAANPFKFGMIGSTDSHTSFANASEDNFFGKFSNEEPVSNWRMKTAIDRQNPRALKPIQYASSGYAAVWAKENTREAIFDAVQRKETYATTGSRIRLRFFGGWDYLQADVQRPDYVARGYRSGVPMGGDLSQAPKGKAPTFMVVAGKDPVGANLDRIQIVKGWLNLKGELQEQVYDVALSDNRKVNPKTGKAPALKATVNITQASYRNSIGEVQLSVVWSDPDFNSEERAFYYVRVLEIPTPRWSTYDAAFFNEPVSTEMPAVMQERAYSSPIWYTPLN